MKTNWIRSCLLAFALCVTSIVTPSFGGEQGMDTAQVATTSRGVYAITVDHDLSLEQMIAAGHYNWVSHDITSKYFPPQGKGKEQLVVELLSIERTMSSDEVINELARRGLRAATLEELFSFGAVFHEEQPKFLIIALGSVAVVMGERRVPYLDMGYLWRSLHLLWLDGGWDVSCRFLAVRN